jgi:hypothetical protein
MKKFLNNQTGLINILIIFIIVMFMVAYFNIDAGAVVNSKPFQWAMALVRGLWEDFFHP